MKQRELEYVARRIRGLAASHMNKKIPDPGAVLDGIRKAILEGRQLKLKPLSKIKAGIERYSGCNDIDFIHVFEVPESYKKDLKAFEAAKKVNAARNKKISKLEQEYVDDVMCGVRPGRAAINEFEAAIKKL